MSPHTASIYLIDMLKPKLKKGMAAGRSPAGTGACHALWMLTGIRSKYIQGEKAHRWLGYAQGILVSLGYFTLDEMKLLNKGS